MAEYHLHLKKYLELSSKSESRLMQLPLSRLVKYLDQLCSAIVILRDKQCVVCGSPNNLTNGHYIHRAVMPLRWNLVNCNCQCALCNSIHEENDTPYLEAMVQRYGDNVLDVLRKIRIEHTRFSRVDLVDIYMELVEEGRNYESVHTY
jgi:hypothetical protein